MRKVKRIIKAFCETFADLAEKVENKSATGDEALAYGCCLLFLSGVMFFMFVTVVVACRIIYHLL